MKRLYSILTMLFGAPEEINGNGTTEAYLYRWILMKSRWGNIYLHHFIGDDWARHLHDHPKAFTSIGLWGSYIEERGRVITGYSRNLLATHKKVFSAPWFRRFPARHIHRLIVPSKNCWTLVIVGKPEREWGFWVGAKWMPWYTYVEKYGIPMDRIQQAAYKRSVNESESAITRATK